jgi:hypothetical protein
MRARSSGELARGLAGDELVHRADDEHGVADDRGDQGGHAGPALRARLHEAVGHEPGDRVAHRGLGDAEPLGEVLLAQLLPRSQGAGDDRLPQRAIGLVLEQDAPGGVEGHN